MLAERFHMDEEFPAIAQPRQGARQGRHHDPRRQRQCEAGLARRTGRQTRGRQAEPPGARAGKGWCAARAYPASVGSEEKPAPSGTLKVVRGRAQSDLHLRSGVQVQGHQADEKLRIAPGPNNPVGLVWIALDQKTYGIHGTSEPSRIGKTESHGCVRLTNWDALALAKLVRKGMPVEFID
jgi:lipoprotein-anchoring transpeptidase ErfK/SrfK